MSKIEGYGVYQKSLYENSVKNKKTKDEKKADKTEKCNKNNQVELSDRAKELLEQLRKTYGNMDFMVADYESEEEASKYLSRGTKEYSVLIEPELLEEMAADEETKEKYLGVINDATDELSKMKEQLGDKKDEVVHLGVSIDKDGIVSYFAGLEKTKKTMVKASTTEELFEKIKNVDWSKVKGKEPKESGSRLDLKI